MSIACGIIISVEASWRRQTISASTGQGPSHRELLDWLAIRLQQYGYHLKPLHRLMVLSATYRQSSRPREDALSRDAENQFLWRFSPHRVEAEVLRDSILIVAGELNRTSGGPGYRDVQVTYNDGTTYYDPFDPLGPEFQRRSVYRFTPRGGRSALMDTFDCPDPSATAPRRSVTTTPLQALSLMNDAFVLRMSDRFAERVRRSAGEHAADQVRQAWQLALARDPDADELTRSCQLVEAYGLSTLCRALFNTNEFVVVE